MKAMRRSSSQSEPKALFPSVASYKLNDSERRKLGILAGKVFRQEGDFRWMMLVLTRFALAHYELIEPNLLCDLRYAQAEGLQVHELWNLTTDRSGPGVRRISTPDGQEALYPTTVSYKLNDSERRKLGSIAGKVLRKKGDYRWMMLVLARCALAHYELMEPTLLCDLRYAEAEGLQVHELWNLNMNRPGKAVRK